ncbi:hypothetical protein LMG26845_03118 [Achromobacter insuavis]|uniref:Uncharacterized protein n=1 Tax=Achromobacter insuavis TaxID=1287735 RepID=A0A6J5A856_9BURK|nr:hypothetical protein LMG26845_03118 [Achromobacter insuavis]
MARASRSRSASSRASTTTVAPACAMRAASDSGVSPGRAATWAQPSRVGMWLSVTGVTGSVAAEVAVTGRPLTISTPSSTVRPVAGKAGHTTAMASSPQASRAASISALKAPRSVESTFLYSRATPAARSRWTLRRITAPASLAGRARLWVVTASTSTSSAAGAASASCAPSIDRRVVQPARTNCTAVSPEPVRSSATMAMAGVTGPPRGPRDSRRRAFRRWRPPA